MTVDSLDNMPDYAFDYMASLGGKNGIRVVDNRKDRNYFLIGEDNRLEKISGVEQTFIWIDGNLWQYRYVNIHVSKEPNWKNPLKALNEILNNSQQ